MHSTLQAGAAVSLRQALPKAQFLSADDVLARSCSADWRACQAGDVFFAVITADDDGHEHAAEAIERGAAAIVAERLLPVTVPQLLVRDSRSAFARVCQALAGNPSQHLRTIGITGTAGKTVTAMLLASIFEAAGETAGVMSSLGHSDSVVQCHAVGSTPTAAEFASWMARMNAARCDAAVLELSSLALAERRTSGVELDVAVLTNIKNANLQEHNTAAAYYKIKRRIFNHLKPDGVAIVNADDHRCRNLLTKLTSPCLTYAIHSEADITASVIERSLGEQTFLLSMGSEVAPVRTRINGDQHVANCLAAAAAAVTLGMEMSAIVRGLEMVERVPGRMERLECGQSFGVFIDAAREPETLALSIKAVRQVTRGRVFVVYGPREGTDAPHRAIAGRVLERGAHVALLTSDEPGQNRPLAIAHDVLDGFERPHKAHIIPNREEAIHFALAQARPGDAVLVAGRGDRVTQLSRDADRQYDDRQAACDWLYGRQTIKSYRPRFRVVG